MNTVIRTLLWGWGCFALALLAGCGNGNLPAGWAEHRDPSGFVVQHPAGWAVSSPNHQWVQIENADHTSLAVVYPFFLNQPSAARDCVRGVTEWLQAIFPNASVDQIRQQSQQPDQATARLSFQRDGVAFSGRAMCGVVGGGGTFFAIAAPRERFEAERDTLVQVVGSLYFTAPQNPVDAGRPADAGVGYTRVYASGEGAFSLEVPQGWRAEAGSYRAAAIDVRHFVSLTSSDGALRITAGDPQVGFFYSPGLMGMMTGMAFGGCYNAGFGYCVPVKLHQGALPFIKEYVMQSVSQWCSGLTFTGEQRRPEVARALQQQSEAQLAMAGIIQETTSGEVTFTCTLAGQRVNGYYFATAQAWGNANLLDGSAQWSVPNLFGYVAPADQASLAQAVIQHAVSTFEMNPQWVGTQQQTTAAVSNIVGQTGQQVSQIFNDSFWAAQGTNAEIYRKWSNQTLGLVHVRDPKDGTERRVEAGNRNYLRVMTTGAVVGTDQDVPESFDVRRLIVLD